MNLYKCPKFGSYLHSLNNGNRYLNTVFIKVNGCFTLKCLQIDINFDAQNHSKYRLLDLKLMGKNVVATPVKV